MDVIYFAIKTNTTGKKVDNWYARTCSQRNQMLSEMSMKSMSVESKKTPFLKNMLNVCAEEIGSQLSSSNTQ